MKFTHVEEAILRYVQGDLPDSLTPFADVAKVCGSSEEVVLSLLRQLKENGSIRRFGASLRHQQAGWGANAMCAWVATPEQADICGPIAARHPNVSHVYYRPASPPEWPYAFYTMVHGRSEAECLAVIGHLAQVMPLKSHLVLKTRRELKKISPSYFN